jgi:hypothetical protein
MTGPVPRLSEAWGFFALAEKYQVKRTCGFLENAAFQSWPDNPLDPPALDCRRVFYCSRREGKHVKGKK